MDVLRGVIERITYHNEETGYTVAKLTPEVRGSSGFGQNREVPVVGAMLGINVGESVELQGRWTIHAEYGRQFVVETMRAILPATVAGIEKYLGSGLIRGVGPVTAKRIVKHFGVETLTIIEEQPARLNEVPSVGRKRTQMIIAAWQEQKAIKEVMLFLQSHGVSTSLATKIYKFYGDDAIGIVRQDPYRLARDIFGIGFLTADRIAQAMGLAPDSPQRVAAGVAYALNQATDEGHVFLPTSELVKQATELLNVSRDEIGLGVVRLWHEDQVKVAVKPGDVELAPVGAPTGLSAGAPPVTDAIPQLIAEHGHVYAAATTTQAEQILAGEHAIYLTPLYYSEQGVANQLQKLIHTGESGFWRFQQQRQDWDALLAAAELTTGLRLAPQQQRAVQATLTHRLTVLTGGPGTGKTTSIRTLLQICEQHGHRVVLAAPTGRAAKRLAETTGREAKTLHRLLEFKPAEGMSFHRNADNPLEGELLIVDEASMLDLVLTNHLLKAIPPGMHLLLVGDVDQLPSVGAGNVLKDIIAAIEEKAVESERLRASGSQASSPSPHRLLAQSLTHQATVIRLKTIFRQAADSFIITNAHRINEGETPSIDNETATDFFLFRTEEPERAAQLCVELVQSRIPKRFAIPSHDIQVLSPMHRGIIGVGALNEALQAGLNPATSQKPEKRIGNRVYRLGDRVMQIRNNYDKDVYNGDMGRIQALDMEMQKVTVNIDGRLIVYDFLELDELVHAFAISVHKCVAAGTYVFTEQGLLEIEHLWQGNESRFFQTKIGVATHLGWGETSHVFRGDVESTVTLTTQYGYTLTGSLRHPILVFDETLKQLVWKKLPELLLGDTVAIARGMNAGPQTYLPLSFDLVGVGKEYVRLPAVLDESLAEFLGFLVAEGSYRDTKDGAIELTNTDPALMGYYAGLFYGLFGVQLQTNQSAPKTRYAVRWRLRLFLEKLGFDYVTARSKCVPPLIMQSLPSVQAAFLRGLFDGDGSVTRGAVIFATASERLASQVQLLLLNLGIIARRTALRHAAGIEDSWRIEIRGPAVGVYLERVGFNFKARHDKLVAHVELQDSHDIPKTNVDFVPNGQQLMIDLKRYIEQALGNARGKKGQGFWGTMPLSMAKYIDAVARNKQRLSFQQLRKIYNTLCHRLPSSVADSSIWRELEKVLDAGYFFDRVVNICQGEHQVYDLCVPMAESFISNGIVSHNSQGSEFPAVVIPILTSHYMMLQRNLLYTAVTRAKRLVVLVGQPKAIAMAVRNNKVTQRFTGLRERLTGQPELRIIE